MTFNIPGSDSSLQRLPLNMPTFFSILKMHLNTTLVPSRTVIRSGFAPSLLIFSK